MCGILGILSHYPVNQEIYDGLTMLQHRGQDAAGVMTTDQQQVFLCKGNGLVRDVLREPQMRYLRGNLGVGHVRYPTAGTHSASESQPFYVNSPYGLSLVHNGNLINAEALANDLRHQDFRHLNTHSDSEILLNVFAHELQSVAGDSLKIEALTKALKRVYKRLRGAYSVVLMITGYGLLAFRDPYGIRPLVYGRRQTDRGYSYMIASESIALDALGYELIEDVPPGCAIWIDLKGKVHRIDCVKDAQRSPCIFEYIYLARPDSVMDKIPVYQARLNMGIKLAQKIMREQNFRDIDVVIPIPDTSRPAAHALAQLMGIPYCEGFVKNRYIGRTFIMPEQKVRRSSVRLKLNAIKAEFKNKKVLLIDDSIVRGTTSREIIKMARDAGAAKVYFASAAPEVRYPNVYGIDMPTVKELIAHDRDLKEITKFIGADWLVFQGLQDVYDAINEAAISPQDRVQRFEDSEFTGNYVTADVDAAYLKQIAAVRNDENKQKQNNDLSPATDDVTQMF